MIRILIAMAVLGGIGAGSLQAQKLPKAQENPAFVIRKAVLPIRTLSGLARGVKALAFSQDDRILLSAGDKEIRIWDASTGEPKKSLPGHNRETHAVAISPDGKRIASSGDDGALIVWDAGSGTAVAHHSGYRYNL
jgi:WD40 repeat protein